MRARRLVAGSRCLATRRSMSYSEHQASLGRPISPHVTIYKQPIPAMSSIANRVAGILLAVGSAGAAVAAAAGYDIPTVIGHAQESVPAFKLGAKFLVAFPLAVHGLGGVRHLVRVAVVGESCPVHQPRRPWHTCCVSWVDQMWDRAPEMITYSYAKRSSKLLCVSPLAAAIVATTITIHSPCLAAKPPLNEGLSLFCGVCGVI